MSRANEPAFPLPLGNENIQPECAGLTKREYFAAMAMQGMLANSDCRTWDVSDDVVRAADALLAELAKKSEGA